MSADEPVHPVDPVYLDNAATTPLDSRVFAALRPWLGERFGNPSSLHRLGDEALGALAAARVQLARAVGARAEEIVFTSGATEANNLAVIGGARARKQHGQHVLVGAFEHACVRASAKALAREGFEVETLAPGAHGQLDLDDLVRRVRVDTVLVAHILVQNETGIVYPLSALARRVRARAPHALVHCDAAQALGKIELSFPALGVDSLALSAHKAHGPMGSGALCVARGVRIDPLLHGGDQERGLRAGTENVAGCVGLGAAAELAERERATFMTQAARWRAEFARGLAPIENLRLVEFDGALPCFLALVGAGIPSAVRMQHLAEEGVLVSAGSACHAREQTLAPSLGALQLSDGEARSFLRISHSRLSVRSDPAIVLGAFERAEAKLRNAPRRVPS